MAVRAAVAAPLGLRRLFCTNSTSRPPPSLPVGPRQMADPSTKLFVSIAKSTTTNELREEFAKFGEVVHARVVTDRGSGSKGYGFVKYATIEEAGKGIEGMNGRLLDGWVVSVEYARRKPAPGQQPADNTTNQYAQQ